MKKSSKPKKTKITIRPYSTPPSLPPTYFPSILHSLTVFSHAALRRLPLPSTSRTQLHSSIADLVSHRLGPQLYSHVVQLMESAAVETASRLSSPPVRRIDALGAFHAAYRNYTEYLTFLTMVLQPLDRAYEWTEMGAVERRGERWMRDVGIELLRLKLGAWAKEAAGEVLEEYDEGGEDRVLVKGCVRACADLGVMDEFVEELVQGAKKRFGEEGARWGQTIDEGGRKPEEFLRHVEKRLGESSTLSSYYLVSNEGMVAALRRMSKSGISRNLTISRLLPSIIETRLLTPNLLPEAMLHPRHLHPILDAHEVDGAQRFENAQRLYTMCRRISHTDHSALHHLRTGLSDYARNRISEIVRPSNRTDERTILPNLLEFRSHLLHLLAAFRSDELFTTALNSALDDAMNGDDGGRRIAELLAKHVDVRFKDAGTGAPEEFQKEIMALFCHVYSKDVFEAFYKRDLAKRLLTGRSVSSDAERSFLSKLKAECGAGYTSKMEGMFKDMELSRDLMSSYAAYSSGATASNAEQVAEKSNCRATEMDVHLLTTGYWPVYPINPNIILPPELLAHQAKFDAYYKQKYQGRRILWQYSLGYCIVKASFPKQPAGKELITSLCQTLVLLCFQYQDGPDGRGLTIDDIIKKTGIEDRAEVERVLQSLSLGRDGTRVLIKVDHDPPKSLGHTSPTSVRGDGSPRKSKKVRRDVGQNDRFLFNSSFVSNQRRIRITNITMKETAEERTQTHEAVSKDRLYLIDATVVRIMKARKTMDHRDLMGEVMAQLKFPSSAADVKKRVESLIEREYMERVEGDRSRYNYLA